MLHSKERGSSPPRRRSSDVKACRRRCSASPWLQSLDKSTPSRRVAASVSRWVAPNIFSLSSRALLSKGSASARFPEASKIVARPKLKEAESSSGFGSRTDTFICRAFLSIFASSAVLTWPRAGRRAGQASPQLGSPLAASARRKSLSASSGRPTATKIDAKLHKDAIVSESAIPRACTRPRAACEHRDSASSKWPCLHRVSASPCSKSCATPMGMSELAAVVAEGDIGTFERGERSVRCPSSEAFKTVS
mmetsp:Transcript_82145/g.180555  ORF Transcript_82145/g.180555 Transcript_82145/m.180555 type:complete len:250 (-) Transcript_82145:823-1572(-)